MSKFVMLALFAMTAGALALPVDSPLPDPPQEARAKALFKEIRCVVCAGESIADSPADVAADMRRDIRGRIAQGESDEEIKTYLTSRYGEGVLMDPSLNSMTALLWFGPLLILALALLLALGYFRQKLPSPLEGEGDERSESGGG